MSTEPTAAERAAYATIVLCPDPACDPANENLCGACRPVFDAAFPDRCPDPECTACREAARAEQ